MINSEIGRGIMASVGLTVLSYFMLKILYDVLVNTNIISSRNLSDDFSERTVGLLAIAVNIILIQYLRKRFMFERIRGVVITSFVFIAIWFFIFRHVII